MTLLEIKNVTKNFGGLTAVDDVSLRLEKGEILGLIGPNGAGKTTLLNIISGVYHPDKGSILLENKRIDNLQPHEIAKRGIARSFQIPRPLKKMTVLENMLVPLYSISSVRDESEVESVIGALLKLVGLDRFENEYAINLSGGQQKLLDFIRVLVSNPKIILGDEIWAGVHPLLKKKIINVIQRLRDEQTALILVSHDTGLVLQICKRIAFMDHGKMLLVGSPDEIKNSKEVIDAYLGET